MMGTRESAKLEQMLPRIAQELYSGTRPELGHSSSNRYQQYSALLPGPITA
jgi:hypothetical protein